ncbi:14365_t:CDS:2 [Dentiscutata erythropus]|uniref:14365_t:CDS:1 n=1 Tax=Dentiscutata erythropus TaxID=1348616 RepID=A0A9N9K460_9GLOM|nr:14365_t:CDS:2 [Dentiscutata erythropus]
MATLLDVVYGPTETFYSIHEASVSHLLEKDVFIENKNSALGR